MKEKILLILDDIHNSVKELNTDDVSLMYGLGGVLLYNFQYANFQFKGVDNGEISEGINYLAENSFTQANPTCCWGKSGVNWIFTYLYQKGVLAKEDRDFLCDDDEYLQNMSLSLLENDNYDFLHGSLGISYYLLNVQNDDYKDYYKNVFRLLNVLVSKSSKQNMIPYFDSDTQKLLPFQVNLGLAHGIPSIVKFCLQCLSQNICPNESRILIHQIINYLLEHQNKEKSMNYFPNVFSEKDGKSQYSRLAWCYGDLGIAYVLYQAGIMLNDRAVICFSLEVLIKTTERKTISETSVIDAGICHGSAGLAHIYNRLWKLSKLPVFKTACDYWINKTIDLVADTNWSDGYKKFNYITKSREGDHYFLEGSVGIGLVLLTYLNEDFTWDYCLMLNN